MSRLIRVLCAQLPKKDQGFCALSKTESQHLLTVLRVPFGTRLEAICPKVGLAAIVELVSKDENAGLILIQDLAARKKQAPISIGLGLLKAPAMALAVEKLTELGIENVFPLRLDHSQPKFKSEKELLKLQERLQRISDQSLKQCGRWTQMQIHPLEQWHAHHPLVELPNKAHRIFLDETSQTGPSLYEWIKDKEKSSGLLENLIEPGFNLLVGPEGGWSALEKNSLKASGFEAVSLGRLILRAETAAICGASLLSSLYWRHEIGNQ